LFRSIAVDAPRPRRASAFAFRRGGAATTAASRTALWAHRLVTTKKVEKGAEEGNGRPKNGVSNVCGVFRDGGFGSLVSGQMGKSQKLRGNIPPEKKEGRQCRAEARRLVQADAGEVPQRARRIAAPALVTYQADI
jgi:hypothetical protein